MMRWDAHRRPPRTEWIWVALLVPVAGLVIVTAAVSDAVRAIARWRRRWPMPERIDLLSNEQIDALPD
jgi:hypothetical protein